MKIVEMQIRNFRILKELDVDLEDTLSLVIGKNNTGKTSFLTILERFLNEKNPEFTFDDFSIEIQELIIAYGKESFLPENYKEIALSLKLYISYDKSDDISNAEQLLLDLDENKNQFVILFEYVLEYEKYQRLYSDYVDYKKNINRDFAYYLSKHINRYFKTRIRALEYGDEGNSKIISDDIVKSVISMQTIGAMRDVDNEQGRSHSLSVLAYKYYSARFASDADFPELQKQLLETDGHLSEQYLKLFEPIVDEIKEMAYNPKEAEIAIISSLSEKRIFQDNTAVKYKHDNTLLPEDYNGLGYLNLFSIVFNIRIKLDQLSKINKPDEKPAPINLLFIEEPEAHTHPQMQYVFIKNIKELLKRHCVNSEKKISLQSIISTHSSHIVSQCNFDDIKYFYRESSISIKSRSLKTLGSKIVIDSNKEEREQQEQRFRFVKQYLTLNRAELFFADKAILLEGDTERILISAMMKKYDQSNITKKEYQPLLSQNISIVEVGAYAQTFAAFLDFLGIKTLIITDLDCAKKNKKNRLGKCRFSECTDITNSSIKFFLGNSPPKDLTKLTVKQRTLSFEDTKWVVNKTGYLLITFQKEENGYQARSFEDSFICKNLNFITQNKDNFKGLKNHDKILETETDYYDIADNCIESKTSFALDIMLYGGIDNEKWEIPLYIREGLEWLAR